MSYARGCPESGRIFFAAGYEHTRMADDANSRERVTVWYDGDCPLCMREITLMRRLDRRRAIRFVDVRAADSCPRDRADLLSRFHAQEDGREVVSGAAAFAAMWRAVPLLRPLGLLARVPPVLWLLEGAYRVFLRLRPWLQHRARAAGFD